MRVVIALASLYGVIVLLGLSNTVGYHRLLTHRSFSTTGWLRTALTLLCAQYSGSPMAWVGAHRVHHTVSDTEGDPHTTLKGFWFAHSGWLIGVRNPIACALFALSGFGLQIRFAVYDLRRLLGKNPPVWRAITRDLEKERFMRFLDVPLVMTGFFVLQLAAAWAVGGVWGLLWLWCAHVVLNNATWIVNSACHWPGVGERPFDTRDRSRNVRWLALLTHGESCHNAHHKYPKSARHGGVGEIDTSWLVIRGLARLGLVWDIQTGERRVSKEAVAVAPVAEHA